jgi:hypothetical protein
VLGLPGAGLALELLTVHTLAMLAAMAGVALLVYARLGIEVLRHYWTIVGAGVAGDRPPRPRRPAPRPRPLIAQCLEI